MDNCQNNSALRPWLSPVQQVECLKEKGVKFELMSEDEAKDYLAQNNNYFRLGSYRRGFARVAEGKRKGEYIKLDFKMLVDLAVIDMLLRFEMLPITLDIEHYSKIKLLNKIESQDEDGYSLVSDYIDSYERTNSNGEPYNRVLDEIDKGNSSPYIAGILAKYKNREYPVWAFLELITFGSFIFFYKFCAERFGDSEMEDDFYLLQSVKSLRNACAHNNCILNNLQSGVPMYRPRETVQQAVAKISTIKRGQRKAKLSNDRLQQITTSLYLHKVLALDGVHENRAKLLDKFLQRMNKHIDYYKGNDQITSSFEYITKIINAWFSLNESFISDETLAPNDSSS